MNITETYRPKTLDQVLGQDHIVKSLSKIITERKHSTFLFEGPSGLGKTTLARICADMLGCSGFDLQEFDAASNSGVDDMRALAEQQYSFPMSGARAFIIDECQRLSKNAWDVLLKGTESPPPNNYWFFCTTEISKVPKTIRTRSAEYKLKPVPAQEITDLLKEVRDTEGMAVTDNMIARLARSVSGSPREALIKLQQCDGLMEEEMEALLSVDQGTPGGYDLAKMLSSSKDFDIKRIMNLLVGMKDESPEGIRQVVRAYFTTFVLRSPHDKWALGVLSEFENPAVEQNYVTDIVMRVARINKWRQS